MVAGLARLLRLLPRVLHGYFRQPANKLDVLIVLFYTASFAVKLHYVTTFDVNRSKSDASKYLLSVSVLLAYMRLYVPHRLYVQQT